MFSYLDIFILDIFLGTNNEPPQNYHPPNCTWNVYWLALDFSTSSEQLATTTHLTHSYCTLFLLRFFHMHTHVRACTHVREMREKPHTHIKNIKKSLGRFHLNKNLNQLINRKIKELKLFGSRTWWSNTYTIKPVLGHNFIQSPIPPTLSQLQLNVTPPPPPFLSVFQIVISKRFPIRSQLLNFPIFSMWLS
jgi:hypothetical protein